MNWKQVLIGIGVGIVIGALITQKDSKSKLSSDTALKIVKKAFKEQGPIDGSWIITKPEKVNKNQLTYEVYRGGITRTFAEKSEQYEFLVDACTGTIIDVHPLS